MAPLRSPLDYGFAGGGAVGHANVRHQNLALLSRTIYAADAPPTRAALASATGLGRATVSRLIQDLLDSGFAREQDPGGATGRGRPGTPIAPAARTIAALGLEVNVHFVAGRALDLGGNTLAEFRLDNADVESDPAGTLRLLGRSAAAMATNLRATGTEVIGARLAIPGLLNAHDQRLLVAPNLGWSDLDPLAMLGREWEALGVPTLTRNDADLQSLTAAYQRPGKLLADGAFLYIFGDVGVGGAIMDRGAPIRGAHGWAGEVGHTTVHADGLACKCGSRGCLEAYAGQNALRRAAGLAPDAPIDALTARLSDGDERATRAVEAAGEALGIAIAIAVNLLDIPRIVFGTSLGVLLPWLTPPIPQELRARVLGHASRGIVLEACPITVLPACTGGALEVLNATIAQPAAWIDRHGAAPAPNGTQHETD